MSRVATKTVTVDESGQRLDRWFKKHFPALPHAKLEKLLRTGQVRIDGGRAKASDRIEEGQTIRIPPLSDGLLKQRESAAPKIPPEDDALMQSLVIHRDAQVIALNKPHGLASQGGSGIARSVDSMLDALRFGKDQRPRLVHRLDRDTSGVLLIARTVPATRALSEALRQRDARKIYWAITAGVPKPKQGTIKLALAKQPGHGPHGRDELTAPAEKSDEGARMAVTHYAVIAQAAQLFAWVALMPVTGRTHQLRAHMAAIGTPILGDFKYGGAAARISGEVAPKLHLHAREIAIRHPDGSKLKVVASLPPHMRKTWELFGFDEKDSRDPFAALPR